MFYKFEITTAKDGTKASAPTGIYETADAAEIAFHQQVAYNMQMGENLSSFLVMIISETGAVQPNLKKFYNFVEPEPEPEPEPSEE